MQYFALKTSNAKRLKFEDSKQNISKILPVKLKDYFFRGF